MIRIECDNGVIEIENGRGKRKGLIEVSAEQWTSDDFAILYLNSVAVRDLACALLEILSQEKASDPNV